MRFLMGLFILFWLGGWAWGWHSAYSNLSSGTAKGGGTFLVVWLGAWTVAGIMAAYWMYRLMRPSVPETLRLTSNGVAYDSGVPPQSYHTGWSQDTARQWRSMLPKRTRVELDRRKLESLRLREAADGNRLTVDVDAQRVEIGQAASEVEREWRYRLLVDRYSLRAPNIPEPVPRR
jgi:hypothetical protein